MTVLAAGVASQDEQFDEGENANGLLKLHANKEANRAASVKAGSSSAARIAMIAITTRSSIRVNAPRGKD